MYRTCRSIDHSHHSKPISTLLSRIISRLLMQSFSDYSGMEVVAGVATVPTYKPGGRIQQFNSFAQLLGDDRAASARANWDKPLKSVVIKRCGLLNTA